MKLSNNIIQFLQGLFKNKIIFIILINLIISIPLAYFLPIWIDEAYSLHTTSKDLSYTITQALYFESQSPFYFILLYIWRLIDDSLFFGRVLSIIFIVITIFLFSRLLKNIDDSWGNDWILLLVAINPFVIWTEVDLRCHTLVLLLTTLLIYFFYLGFFVEKSNRRHEIAYIFTAIIAIYTHYYLGYLLVANAIVLLIFKRWHALGYYLMCMILVFLCFIPYLSIFQKQLLSYNDPSRNIYTLIGSIKFIILRIEDYYLIMYRLGFKRLLRWILRILLAILLIIQLRRFYLNREKLRNKYEFIILSGIIISIISLFLIFTLSVFSETILRHKHTSVLFIPTIIFFIITLSNFKKEDKFRKYLIIWHILLIIFYSYVLFRNYRPMAIPGDWKKVASFIKKEEKPNQPILVFRSELQLPLEYHYEGVNKIIPIPKPIDYSRMDYSQFSLTSENELEYIFEPLKDEIHSYWLITDILESYLGVNFNNQLLEEYIKNNFDTVYFKKFGDIYIRFIKPKI